MQLSELGHRGENENAHTSCYGGELIVIICGNAVISVAPRCLTSSLSDFPLSKNHFSQFG